MVGDLLDRARIPQSREISRGENRTWEPLGKAPELQRSTLITTCFNLRRNDPYAVAMGRRFRD